MPGRPDWSAFRTCDALVESAIADGAYLEALEHLVHGHQRVIVSFCRRQLGAAGESGHVWSLKEVLLYRVPPWPQPQV